MGNNLLKGKTGIITGALDEDSIAWKVAEQVYEEGGRFVLTNAPVAERMGVIQRLVEKTESVFVPADATSIEDLENLINITADKFGKIDFMLHSIGMSPNVRKKREYTNLNYDWFLKTLDVSAVTFHKLMQVAYRKEIMNEWGSIVGLSFIASQLSFPYYSDMSHAKSVLEFVARTFGMYFGTKYNVRVNTISQSPTPTTAGMGVSGFDIMMDFGHQLSPLSNATAEECANFVVMMFSDYTRKVTMQNLFHDGGFSSVGISPLLLKNKYDHDSGEM